MKRAMIACHEQRLSITGRLGRKVARVLESKFGKRTAEAQNRVGRPSDK